jgi:hypothetical protein
MTAVTQCDGFDDNEWLYDMCSLHAAYTFRATETASLILLRRLQSDNGTTAMKICNGASWDGSMKL